MAFRNLIGTVFIALLASTQIARAHSFDVAIVAEADAMDDVRAGFRVATRERDGHANEESDGHLGGLDVYIVSVEASSDLGAVRAKATAADIVLLAIGEGVLQLSLWSDLAGSGLPVIRFGSLPGGEAWADDSASASFRSRYQAEAGRAASPEAALGYIAARRIELTVRPLGGVGDSRALADGLAASDAAVDW